jgi:hypothetical protein
MAEVLVNEGGGIAVGGMMSMVMAPIKFVFANWFYFVIGVLLLVCIVVIISLIYGIKEKQTERDEPGYFNYKKTIRDCKDNAKKKLIRKKYSMMNLFWLGIPFKWNDRSARILNSYNDKIGFYRGELSSQDGFKNLLICQSTSFGIMENLIVLKVPSQLKIKNKDAKTKKVTEKVLNFDLIKEEPFDNSMVVNCIGTERVGLYYHIPILRQDSGEIADFRQFVEGSIAENVYQTMFSRSLGSSMKQMEKAMSLNPNLKFQQMSPNKTSPESDLDNEDK